VPQDLKKNLATKRKCLIQAVFRASRKNTKINLFYKFLNSFKGSFFGTIILNCIRVGSL
jgi:hypothetical protein